MSSPFSLKALGLPRTPSVKAVTGHNLDAVACVLLEDESNREVFGSLSDRAIFDAPENAVADRLFEELHNGLTSRDMNTDEALAVFERHAEWLDFFSN